MWLRWNPRAHPGQGCQGIPGRRGRARRQNAQISSVLTGCGVEGGAEVQAVLMLAPCLPLLVEPQLSLREAVSEWDPSRTNPDIRLDADTGEQRGPGSPAQLLPGPYQETCTSGWGLKDGG